MIEKRSQGIVLLLVAAVLWSTGGLLIKYVQWHALAIAGVRSAIAAAVLVLYLRKLRFTWSPTQIGAAVAYALTVILFVAANKLTTAANAIVLQYTAPVHIALFGAWFLGERTTVLDWITIFIVLGGMVLFFVEGLDLTGTTGNLLAIASGVSFAWMTLLLRKQKNESPGESIVLGNVLAALIGLPFAFAEPGPDAAGWAALAVLGVFQLGLAYILYTIAIRHVTALEAVLVPVIEPILNPVWVFFLLAEVPSRFAVAGGIIVLGAVTIRGVLTFRWRPQAATARQIKIG